MAKVQEYKKAIAAFIGSLVPVYAVVIASDWSTKNGILASIVPIVAAVVTYFSPKNVEPGSSEKVVEKVYDPAERDA